MFYYLCYEGSVDLDEIDDIAKRHALEVQISEFGQVPKQLFHQPHVPRMVDIPQTITLRDSSVPVDLTTSPDEDDDLTRRLSIDDGSGMRVSSKVKMDFEYLPHRLEITSMFYEPARQMIYSSSHDGTLKSFDWANKKQTRSVNLGTMPISSCVHIPETELFVLGCWDNSM